MLLRFFILTIGPICDQKTKLHNDESESLFYRPSVQGFCISRGTNTHFRRFAEWNHGCLGEKSSENSSKITCYAHCSDVFEDIKPFTTTRWNTFLKSQVKKSGHSERPSSKSGQCRKGIFAWSWRYSTKWNDSNKT